MLNRRNILPAILRILRSERGEVGTAEGDTANDPGQTADAPASDDPPAETTAAAEGDTTEGAPEAQPEESFIDPATLPPELKAHWKRMHGSFTKRMQEIRGVKDKASSYDRFFTDPEFAKEIVSAVAPKLGINLAPQADPNGKGAKGGTVASDVPNELIEAVRGNLPDELKWMAESLAASSWETNKRALAPILQKQKQAERQRLESEFDACAAELSESAPTWEDREAEMNELLEFIRGGDLRHPKFGNKLQVLFNMVNGPASATAEAVRRMSNAGRSRVTTGRPSTSTTPNIAERVKTAKNDQEAWDVAAKAALEQLKRGAA